MLHRELMQFFLRQRVEHFDCEFRNQLLEDGFGTVLVLLDGDLLEATLLQILEQNVRDVVTVLATFPVRDHLAHRAQVLVGDGEDLAGEILLLRIEAGDANADQLHVILAHLLAEFEFELLLRLGRSRDMLLDLLDLLHRLFAVFVVGIGETLQLGVDTFAQLLGADVGVELYADLACSTFEDGTLVGHRLVDGGGIGIGVLGHGLFQ